MISSKPFKVLHYELDKGTGRPFDFGSPLELLGGGGLAAALFGRFGLPDEPALDPRQPLIFAIGPLTAYYPLMSKVCCAFKSPYNEHYAESYAGGRLAMAMRFAGYDAIVLTGRARTLSDLIVGGRKMELVDVHYLAGFDVFDTGKNLRHFARHHTGHRSTIRIGPAGENLCEFACINVDTYRHFGRLGAGAVMGSKNLKALQVLGDEPRPIQQGKEYPQVFRRIYEMLTSTDVMLKYHNLGTPENLVPLNELSALPWNNLQKTRDPERVDAISGESFAEQLLLRQTACAGCPVGCIHVGLLREKFSKQNDFLYRQVSYDFEPLFALGSMLGMGAASDVLAVIDETERQGLDVISTGGVLAWATEAAEKGFITERETIVPLAFGDPGAYRKAIGFLGSRVNDFYRVLGQGALAAARAYGGEDFACVLGQEMAGYATGEVFYVSQALGLRHSHLDSGGYAFDQRSRDKDPQKAVAFLVEDERRRVLVSGMAACLFSRAVYTDCVVQDALAAMGMKDLADTIEPVSRAAQKRRWQAKFATGYDQDRIVIPKRYLEVVNWKGQTDPVYLAEVRELYQGAVADLAEKEAG